MKITRPVLLIDEDKCKANISVMSQKATQSGAELIPHFKTHQSIAVGEWFKTCGIKKITVSSIAMAEYFAENGWKDIYVAFPCNILEIDKINKLLKSVNLTILISDIAVVALLQNQLTSNVNARIEIDSGARRTGIQATDFTKIEKAIIEISIADKINLVGFYSHAGHSYSARSKDEIVQIFEDLKGQMLQLKHKYNLPISMGDTPCCSVANDFSDFESIHPGNFVFYDIMQVNIGSCDEAQIGIALAAPVVFKNEDTLEIVVHGGGVHLSKDQISTNGKSNYGKVVRLNEDWWSEALEGCFVKAISQEHGVLSVTKNVFETIEVGDVIGILPVHSCMTADCMQTYYDLNGRQLDHLKGSGSILH